MESTAFVAQLVVCRDTLYRGLYELETNAYDNFPSNRIRTVGGGRKSIIEKHPELLDIFDEIASLRTAGLPHDEEVIWLTVSTSKIVSLFKDRGIDISPYVVCQMKRIRGFTDHYLKRFCKIPRNK